MTYYYIHVFKGCRGGDGRFSLLFHCSELATPNQSDPKECGDVCVCVRVCKVESAVCEHMFLLFNMFVLYVCGCVSSDVWSVTFYLCVCVCLVCVG